MYDEDLLSHILTGEGIRNYPQDLRQLSAEELRALFAFASSGGFFPAGLNGVVRNV